MDDFKAPTIEAVSRGGDMEFRRLLGALPAAAYICDPEGLISYYNGHAADLWGREPQLNHPVDRYCGSFKLFAADGTPISHDKCWMALALRNNQEYSGKEIIIQRPDGNRRTVLANASPFHNEQGRVTGAVNVLVDITSQKTVEVALREADRRKTDFLAMLSHELRNPLAPIRNGLRIMKLAGDDAETLGQARAMMERQAEQLVRLIDDLLDLSRITNGKVELRKRRIDISAAVRDAVETCQPIVSEASHELTVSIPAQPIYVEADRNRLAQVFSNLLHNSVKYTPNNGQIGVHVERQGSDVLVKVKDNGIGIPPDMVSKIFEMFTQVEPNVDDSQGGLGIGLSLVQGLVERHAGRVEVHSGGLGKGAEFTVRLPVAFSGGRETPVESGTSDVIPCTSQYRILVVDDNRDSALSMAMMLKIMGHQTQTAHDGLEAVKVAESFRPDVALLDIGLPKLDGYDACRRIREQPWGKNIVFIAQTGWGQEEDKRKSKEAGFNFHMVKPVDPAALERLLADLLLTPV